MKINILGLDPSFRNWGLSKATYDTDSQKLSVLYGEVLTSKHDLYEKQNQKDLYSACLLTEKLKQHWTNDIDLVCIELPHGSQSARAMVSYGVVLGVLSHFLNTGTFTCIVSASQVKSIVGHKDASKKEIIQWVTDKHQEFTLPKTLNKAEHIADSIVAIHAVLASKRFEEYLNENSTQL